MDEYIKREDALRQVLMVEKRDNMYKCVKNIPATCTAAAWTAAH